MADNFLLKHSRDTTEDDLRFVADNLRQADLEELQAVQGGEVDPLAILLKAARQSKRCITLFDKEKKPVAVYGFAPVVGNPNIVVPWLLGTEGLTKYARAYLKGAREVVAQELETCSLLVNYVHCRNTLSVKFLQRVGFVMDDPKPYGRAGDLFHKFHLQGKLPEPTTLLYS